MHTLYRRKCLNKNNSGLPPAKVLHLQNSYADIKSTKEKALRKFNKNYACIPPILLDMPVHDWLKALVSDTFNNGSSECLPSSEIKQL